MKNKEKVSFFDTEDWISNNPFQQNPETKYLSFGEERSPYINNNLTYLENFHLAGNDEKELAYPYHNINGLRNYSAKNIEDEYGLEYVTSQHIMHPYRGISKRTPDVSSFLSPQINLQDTSYNISSIQKSGVSPTDILSVLSIYFDIGFIEASLINLNKDSSVQYNIRTSGQASIVDSVFTEAVHQLQILFYSDPNDYDGKIGPSTLETMGFLKNGLRGKTTSLLSYREVLKGINSDIETLTNREFNADNWFNYIIQPAWLGIKLDTGVHILLYRKLKEAQDWLLEQPQHQGLSPAGLGQKLGLAKVTGSRSLEEKEGMHAYGLAIDIDSDKNPFVGAWWIKFDKIKLTERTRMLDVLKKTSGQNLSGSNIFSYLDSVARDHGTDTLIVFNILKQHHNEFVTYLSQNPAELSFWRRSATFSHGVAARGFLHLHPDLVYALRQIAGLAWGAIDFGPRASGDIMHFDYRTIDIGRVICNHIGGHVPAKGYHPTIINELNESEHQEAVEEAYWTDETNSNIYNVINEPEWQNENDLAFLELEELNNDPDYQHYSNQIDSLVQDWSNAIRLNRYYADKLGWNQYYDQINDLLLPFSGQQNVSLGEEAFVEAAAAWQQAQGLTADGIIGPNTWNKMKLLLNTAGQQQPPTPSLVNPPPPSGQNIFYYNKWFAQKILDAINAGIVAVHPSFNPKTQLEMIVLGFPVKKIDPKTTTVQILPIMYHICNEAFRNNYRDIMLGSFIRDPYNGKCIGHCAGRCIDINFKSGSFATSGSVQMVINILIYLATLPIQYKKDLRFGLPLQGDFFGNKNLPKFSRTDPSNLIDPQLRQLISQLGMVFPDNDNHLHIQVKWI